MRTEYIRNETLSCKYMRLLFEKIAIYMRITKPFIHAQSAAARRQGTFLPTPRRASWPPGANGDVEIRPFPADRDQLDRPADEEELAELRRRRCAEGAQDGDAASRSASAARPGRSSNSPSASSRSTRGWRRSKAAWRALWRRLRLSAAGAAGEGNRGARAIRRGCRRGKGNGQSERQAIATEKQLVTRFRNIFWNKFLDFRPRFVRLILRIVGAILHARPHTRPNNGGSCLVAG